ncbi:hypothetical protein BURK2_03126 [Burkholderiales bacterium]|nr:MAG: hypothetical protein F9K47_17075 [Burkholderiales bacterium]CAG1002239.1 hypothetical protein BURK2_03126 [Burkholderiales bacterium]
MPAFYHRHCKDCPYNSGAHLPKEDRQIRNAPLSMEDNGAAVLLIFQAPGVEEWRQGRPVISRKPHSAGSRMAAAFKLAGQCRKHYNITNTVQCFPGKRAQQGNAQPRDNAPSAKARCHCSNWLLEDIQSFNFERIVVFGAAARKTIVGLGLHNDARFCFVRHPTAGISIECLAEAIRLR